MKRGFMSMRRSFFLIGLFFLVSSGLFALDPGEVFPSFSVVSGDGKILISPDLEGRWGLVFYEDRNETEKNNALKSYFQNQSLDDELVALVFIADCTDAGLRKKIWENQLKDSSRRMGVTVYGDWNGKLKRGLGAVEGEAFFYLIDPEGIIRYFKEGTVPEGDFQEIQALLNP